MKAELKLDYYRDGIDETKVICTDIPIAAACGYYNVDNYFYFLLQKFFYKNWKFDKHYENKMFENMGLRYREIIVKDTEMLKEKVKIFLKDNKPVLLPIKYCDMFFSSEYKKSQSTHFILLSGYNVDVDIWYMRLSPHVISDSVLNENIGLYPFRVKEKMVLDMWKQTNYKYCKEKNFFQNKIFVVEQEAKSNIIDIYQLLNMLFSKNFKLENEFLNVIKNYQYKDKEKLEYDIYFIRAYYIKYVIQFFEILKKYINRNNKKLCEKIDVFLERYIQTRSINIAKLQAKCLRGEELEIESVMLEEKAMECDLLDIIAEIKHNLQSNYEINGINYVNNSIITASSEDKIYFDCENVRNDDNEIWRSDNVNAPHWLMFEFNKEIKVKKMNICHDSNFNKITMCFCIEGSKDMDKWELLDSVVNNSDITTTHLLKGKAYRYIRIYITEPSKLYNQARIRKVEIYGMEDIVKY